MSGRMLAAAVIVVIGILAILAGVEYLTQPAHALPSFFPGHAAHALGKHTKRGVAALIVGIVLIIIGIAVGAMRSRAPTFSRR